MTTSDLPGVDPRAIASAEEFASALTALREARGMSIRELSRTTGTPSGTLGGYFAGRHLPPLTQPHLFAQLLEALGVDDPTPWREALQRVRRAPGPRRRTDPPYPGLEPFDVDDAARFHGRERYVDDLVGEVALALADPEASRAIAVVGPSGSGKSSVLRAGVVARLRGSGVGVALVLPGARPMSSLAAALRAEPAARVLVVDQLEEVFAAADAERAEFLAALAAYAEQGVVLVSLRADFYPQALAEPSLLRLLGEGQRLLGAMSASELRDAIQRPALAAGSSVSPDLTDLLLRDLARRGTEGAYDAGSLPFLSHALLATWEAARGGILDVAAYRASGGVDGAIRTSADAVYDGLSDGDKVVARQLFAQLVHVDDDRLVTRRRLAHADLVAADDDALERVVAAFVARRILTAGEHALDIGHEALLEAWPRLREWIAESADHLRVRRRVAKAAVAWEEYGHEDAQLLGGTLLSLAEGLAGTMATDGVVLSAAERRFVEASRAHADRVAAAERRSRRRGTKFVAALAALVVVAAGLAAYAFWAEADADRQREVAEAAGDEPLSRQLATQAAATQDRDPALAAQLALAAYRAAPTVEARSALLDTTARSITSRFLGPAGDLATVEPSPDGSTVAVGGEDGSLRFYALRAGRSPRLRSELQVGDGVDPPGAPTIAWRADGRALAVGGLGPLAVVLTADLDAPKVLEPADDGTVRRDGGVDWVDDMAWLSEHEILSVSGVRRWTRWRLQGERIEPVPDASVRDVPTQGFAVQPRQDAPLVAVFKAGGVRILRPGPGGLVPVTDLPLEGRGVELAWSGDGRWLAVATRAARVLVWDLARPTDAGAPTEVGAVESGGVTDGIAALAVNRDGSRIAAGTYEGGIQTWRVLRLARRDWALAGQQQVAGVVRSLAFNPADGSLVSWADDGLVRFEEPNTRQVATRDGDFSTATSVYAPDGTALYVVNDPVRSVVRRIDTTAPAHLRLAATVLRPPGPGEPSMLGAWLSPDGRLLMATEWSGDAMVWRRDGSGWRFAGRAPMRIGAVNAVAFSPDGSRFATAGEDGGVALLGMTADSRPELRWTDYAEGRVNEVALSPDGTLLVATTEKGQARVWSLEETEPRRLPRLQAGGTYGNGVDFSPDGTLLAIGGEDRTVHLFRVADTEIIPLDDPISVPAGVIGDLRFSTDGRSLIAAGDDGSLWVWRVDGGGKGTLWARLHGAATSLSTVAVDPRGGWVTAGGEGAVVTTWQLSPEAAAKRVCALSGMDITRAEWRQHAPGAPFMPPCA